MKGCSGLLQSLTETPRGFRQPPAPIPPPPPPPAPAPAPAPTPSASASHWKEATDRFLGYVVKSKERNDDWLSVGDIFKMFFIFEKVEKAAKSYLIIADGSNDDEARIRLWVQRELELRETDSDWM